MTMMTATIASGPPPRSCLANASSAAKLASGGIWSGTTLQYRFNPTNGNSANHTEQSDHCKKRQSRYDRWRGGVWRDKRCLADLEGFSKRELTERSERSDARNRGPVLRLDRPPTGKCERARSESDKYHQPEHHTFSAVRST